MLGHGKHNTHTYVHMCICICIYLNVHIIYFYTIYIYIIFINMVLPRTPEAETMILYSRPRRLLVVWKLRMRDVLLLGGLRGSKHILAKWEIYLFTMGPP